MVSMMRWLAITGVAALAFGVLVPSVSHADCAAPEVVPAARRARIGERLAVEGSYWTNECNDTQVCSVGCIGGESCTGVEPADPLSDISLVLRPAGDPAEAVGIVLVSGIDADRDLEFEAVIRIPSWIEPGRYVLWGTQGGGNRAVERPSRPIQIAP
jgi:hypothetical protein